MGITTMDMGMDIVTAMIIVTATVMDIVMIITTGMITSTHTIMVIIIIIMTTAMTTRTTTTDTATNITVTRTGKAEKSSWSKTFSPTTTCWPSAIAAILKRRISPH